MGVFFYVYAGMPCTIASQAYSHSILLNRRRFYGWVRYRQHRGRTSFVWVLQSYGVILELTWRPAVLQIGFAYAFGILFALVVGIIQHHSSIAI